MDNGHNVLVSRLTQLDVVLGLIMLVTQFIQGQQTIIYFKQRKHKFQPLKRNKNTYLIIWFFWLLIRQIHCNCQSWCCNTFFMVKYSLETRVFLIPLFYPFMFYMVCLLPAMLCLRDLPAQEEQDLAQNALLVLLNRLPHASVCVPRFVQRPCNI